LVVIKLIFLSISLIVGLVGATMHVHCYDLLSNKWSR
jgi:hypothetical protein